MGLYALTSGSNGIGRETAKLLRKNGHEVINIEPMQCDIEAEGGL